MRNTPLTDKYPPSKHGFVPIELARKLEHALRETKICLNCLTVTGSANKSHVERAQRVIADVLNGY